MNCKHGRQLSAFYDGELSPPERSALEAHLAGCPQCRAELERLRALSNLIAGQSELRLPEGLVQRLHERIDAAGQVVVVRLAERLMAVAAAVLVASALWLWQAGNSEATARIEPWETALIARSLPASPEATEEDILAGWIVADLSEGEGN